MTSRTMRTSDEYGTEILAMLQNNQIDRRKVGGAIIASVVPKVMHALIGAVVRYLHTEPLIVGSGIKPASRSLPRTQRKSDRTELWT